MLIYVILISKQKKRISKREEGCQAQLLDLLQLQRLATWEWIKTLVLTQWWLLQVDSSLLVLWLWELWLLTQFTIRPKWWHSSFYRKFRFVIRQGFSGSSTVMEASRWPSSFLEISKRPFAALHITRAWTTNLPCKRLSWRWMRCWWRQKERCRLLK